MLFHHGERFLDLLDVVRSTRATLASHADAKATRTRYQGTARRTAGVHDRVHGENGSDSDSDDNDASHQDDARRGARAGGDGGRGVGGGVGGGGGGSSVRGGPSRKRGAPVVDVDAAVPVGDGDAEGGGDGPARKKVTLVVDADAEMRRAAGASPAAAAPAGDSPAAATAAPAADPPPRSAAAAPAAASVPPPEGGGREAGGGSSASQGKRAGAVGGGIGVPPKRARSDLLEPPKPQRKGQQSLERGAYRAALFSFFEFLIGARYNYIFTGSNKSVSKGLRSKRTHVLGAHRSITPLKILFTGI